jgi:peptidoglycan/xylan/chitin deacetylase (PgdA/CDA1 family)
MRPLIAAALFVAFVPAAVAALRVPPEPGPAFPPEWAQRAAMARLLARGDAVYCGGGNGDAVALSFDDGPGPYTAQLLRVLRRYGAHATFFVVGNRIQYWPELVGEEARAGGVGNHTWSHPALTRLPRWLVWLELARTQFAVDAEVGWKPHLFRAPYGLHSRETDAIVHRLGLLEVFWDVDSHDDVPNARVRDVVRSVERGLRPGAIVEMHDLHPWTLAALPRIMQAMRARGLRAVSVSELLALDPPAPDQRCPYAPVVGA